jgi:hypothetical protein
MDGQKIVIPYLDYAYLGELAEGIIAKYHPSRQLPIPIDDIIDPRMQLDIFPLPGLTKATAENDGIVAYVNSALTCITVDEDAWEAQTSRYRFSIAHELAHMVVHRNILGQFHYGTVQEWQQAMKAIPSQDYGRLEWQANAFAGHLLMPTTELRSNFESIRNKIIEQTNINPDDEGVRLIIEKRLADIFGTSSMTAHIRLEKEGF